MDTNNSMEQDPLLPRNIEILNEFSEAPPSYKITNTSLALFAITFYSFVNLDYSPRIFVTVFFTLISGMLTTPYQISYLVIPAVIILSLSNSFICKDNQPCTNMSDSFDIALDGFSKQLSWLVFLAFQIGLAVQTTGLGKRLSLIFISYLGSSIIGLGYAIFLTELFLSPFIPSNTARAGGIVMPIVVSMAELIQDISVSRFLVLSANHANFLVSAMFMTSTIGNPLIVRLTYSIFGIEISFLDWFMYHTVNLVQLLCPFC